MCVIERRSEQEGNDEQKCLGVLSLSLSLSRILSLSLSLSGQSIPPPLFTPFSLPLLDFLCLLVSSLHSLSLSLSLSLPLALFLTFHPLHARTKVALVADTKLPLEVVAAGEDWGGGNEERE